MAIKIVANFEGKLTRAFKNEKNGKFSQGEK